MASSRKKQDEKNLKTLRELASQARNKYCFDCNQRGPTYVNVTIGSFVCTKCSGMLRGLTPPHRVKSISMATFTNEEIDLLKKRGNEYCQKVWLGLYENSPPHPGAASDECTIRDFMVEKYERRRFYLEPSKITIQPNNNHNININNNVTSPKSNGIEITANRPRPEVKNCVVNTMNSCSKNISNNNVSFEADFSKANIFNGSSQNNKIHSNGNNGFANFDNNPVFTNGTSTSSSTTEEDFSIFDLYYSDTQGPILNQVPLFPKCNTNRWSIPATTFPAINGWSYTQPMSTPNHNTTGLNNSTFNSTLNGTSNGSGSCAPVPSEDKYAALKDLDNEFKSQKNLEWSSTNSNSNGSLYSSPTPVSSPSPQSSIFESPNQVQFMGTFPLSGQENGISNPFSNGSFNNWNGQQQQQHQILNPFRDTTKLNGFQPAAFSINSTPMFVNGTNGWTPNPFKVGATGTMNSNNPFL